MSILRFVLIVGVISLLTACGSSPEKEKARAEAEYTEEKTKTLKEYKTCVKKAGEDKEKLDACERLLKAAE